MPRISERIADSAPDGLDIVQPQRSPAMPTPPPNEDRFNPFLRSPLPPLNSNPDSLRQFYRDSVPLFRIFPVK